MFYIFYEICLTLCPKDDVYQNTTNIFTRLVGLDFQQVFKEFAVETV